MSVHPEDIIGGNHLSERKLHAPEVILFWFLLHRHGHTWQTANLAHDLCPEILKYSNLTQALPRTAARGFLKSPSKGLYRILPEGVAKAAARILDKLTDTSNKPSRFTRGNGGVGVSRLSVLLRSKGISLELEEWPVSLMSVAEQESEDFVSSIKWFDDLPEASNISYIWEH